MTRTPDLLITNACVLTMDADRRILWPGWIAIAGGRISEVGAGAAPDGMDTGRVIDADGGVVHPGLIDAHAHVAWGIARCFVPERFTEDEVFWRFDAPMLATVTDEEEHLGTRLACLEMALNGTTCFADTGSASRELSATAEAVEAVGIRGMIALLNGDAFDGVPELSMPTDTCVDRIERSLSAFPLGAGRAWACPGLVGMETSSDELVAAASELAARAGVPLNVHKSFSPGEVHVCRERLGGRDPIDGYRDLGVLDRPLTLVHMNLTSDHEVGVLADARPGIVHCPSASMMYAIGGSRTGRFPELVSAGVPVALGTDSTQWQNSWDLHRAVYLAATVHKEARGEEQPAIDAESALEMATLGGAAAVGRLHELGSIEPGKLADLVLHGRDRPEAHPAVDPVGSLVFSSGSRTVRTVLVEGEPIVVDGRSTRIDHETLYADVDRAGRGLMTRLDYRPGGRWPVFTGQA
ncbi:MAG: 5-methylthioadenosine/S-adenosylhomocysteine deaminase [Gaiellales bacterium]|jgi:cytosine/adenosine deaminase-related metal-dependent hydrolase|nr:5-methylthioadenosine/S-adenosylhomocysteine deaminase [Gaiellales bacterium]